MNPMFRRLTTAASILLLAGCMSWTPGWQDAIAPKPPGPASQTFEQAESLFDSAGSRDQLRSAIDAYEIVVRSAPSDLPALTRLAEAQILFGAAYAVDKKEKAEWYRSGIRTAERAMATNEDFRRDVESGRSIGDASHSLGVGEMRPMLFWVTGVSYYFKECLSGVARLVHFRWMLQTRKVMDRMLEVDAGFEDGPVLFSLAIYHIAAPPAAGRDLTLAANYFDRALADGPESLLLRWGRAKYLHVQTGNRDGFRGDLEWVLAQDPTSASSAYPWNVYFQRDAKTLLGGIDQIFN